MRDWKPIGCHGRRADLSRMLTPAGWAAHACSDERGRRIARHLAIATLLFALVSSLIAAAPALGALAGKWVSSISTRTACRARSKRKPRRR